MAGLTLATFFMPEWLLPWIAVLAVGALIMGARTLALIAFSLLAVEILLVPMLSVWLFANILICPDYGTDCALT